MNEIKSLKTQLAAAKIEIANLTLRLKNVEFLYRQELNKSPADNPFLAQTVSSN